MNLKIKKYVPFILVLVAIVILSGTSYALLRSTSKGSNPYVMNVGVLEISFQDSEEDKLTLVNQIPISDDEGMDSEDEYTFTIKNTGTLPATYFVYIEETSTNPEFKSVIRYITSKNNQEYGAAKTLSEDKYIDTNATLGIDETATYKVKLWLSIDADSTYMNKTFTARIVVDTTLNYNGFSTDTDKLIENNVVNYATASASDFSGGLVAINNEGTLYNETDTTQAIREYRYSGPTVNNYVFFDTDGDGTKTNEEIWRIVGIFKNDVGNWNLKLMRNTVLTSSEISDTYTYGGTTYQIESTINPGFVAWNSTKTATNYNDWTTAGLQYYLNETDGYFGTLSNEAQTLIDISYTYYLGNVTTINNSADDTTITSYKNERASIVCGSNITSDSYNNNCNVWYGNKTTWEGKVVLLYPSDLGYSASPTHWNTNLYNYNYNGVINTSWMAPINDAYGEWFLSPESDHSEQVAYWYGFNGVRSNYSSNDSGRLRPTLNLLSSAPIDTNHQGNETDPYVIVIE